MDGIEKKYALLRESLSHFNSLAIAFSGGVDSTLLLTVAHEVLGSHVVAISCLAPMVPAAEAKATQHFCAERGIKQLICYPDVLSVPEFRTNQTDRCYYCKKFLFNTMIQKAQEAGFPVIADGTNVDDTKDYRPGMKALHELNVVSPLLDAGFTKNDIRLLSRKLNLQTWNTQSNACLATRFPYNTELSVQDLSRVDEAEAFLHRMGFEKVRVRVYQANNECFARIEIDPTILDNADQFVKLFGDGKRATIVHRLKALDFDQVTLDLQGFRSGSMNESIKG